MAYVSAQGGAAAALLAEIRPSYRTHPLDAVGVATFAAMRADDAARIDTGAAPTTIRAIRKGAAG